MSSLQQQVTEVAGAHPIRVPQQRMPSSHAAVSAGRAATGDVSPRTSGPLARANSRHLAWRGSALPLQHLFHYRSQRRPLPQPTRRPCPYRPLWRRNKPSHGSFARGQGADGDPISALSTDSAQSSTSTGVHGAVARDRLLQLWFFSPGYPTLEFGLECRQRWVVTMRREGGGALPLKHVPRLSDALV